MNERIKKMSEQAHLVADATYAKGPDSIWLKEYNKKFAELIVQECMKVVIDGQYSDTVCEGNSHRVSYNNGRYGASSDIKEHFGVEE